MAKSFVFFDERAVRDALNKGTRRALSKFGAYVRTRAKSSIRKRKGVSKPGSPPSSHTGKLKKYIYFGYDQRARSVVIGAVPFSNSRAQELLEHGGRTRLRQRVFRVGQLGPLRESDVGDRRRWARLRTNAQAVRATRLHNGNATYRARPFMTPAFIKELRNLKPSFSNCMR